MTLFKRIARIFRKPAPVDDTFALLDKLDAATVRVLARVKTKVLRGEIK